MPGDSRSLARFAIVTLCLDHSCTVGAHTCELSNDARSSEIVRIVCFGGGPTSHQPSSGTQVSGWNQRSTIWGHGLIPWQIAVKRDDFRRIRWTFRGREATSEGSPRRSGRTRHPAKVRAAGSTPVFRSISAGQGRLSTRAIEHLPLTPFRPCPRPSSGLRLGM